MSLYVVYVWDDDNNSGLPVAASFSKEKAEALLEEYKIGRPWIEEEKEVNGFFEFNTIYR